MRITLQGKRIDTDRLAPSNLVFLLDVSGSMESPDKLPLVKAAFRLTEGTARGAVIAPRAATRGYFFAVVFAALGMSFGFT